MNAFIFVAIICMNQQCEFFASTKPITEARCQQLKHQFLGMVFKPEVTLAASQCMIFDEGVKI
jgi:hypothetical protein